jgi:hypothetical protein
VKRREKRAGLHDESPARDLRNTIGDGHSVLGAKRECPQDQEIECSTEQIRLLRSSHMRYRYPILSAPP